jgi:hypothetical protein
MDRDRSPLPGRLVPAIIAVMDGGLSAAEREQLAILLQRFVEHDLDQDAARRLDTGYGLVCVRISKELRAGEPASASDPFRVPPGDPRSAGRRLLGGGPVTLYYRIEVLDRATAELRDAGYHIVQADASRWLTVRDMHGDLSRILRFPGYYGENLNALDDCLADVIGHEYGFPAGAAGLVLTLTGFDEFAREFPDIAHGLLDVIAGRSRSALLAGEHFLCLVQSGDPQLMLPPVDAIRVRWNQAEWLNASRGLPGTVPPGLHPDAPLT